MPSLQETAVAIAVSQLGVHEQGGNNQGPQVNEYLASVGLAPGYSWCAAFVFYCFKQAAQQLGLVNPCPHTAGAVRLWTLTEPICRDLVAAPGAIYVLDHGGGKGHAGIIESIDEDGTITEISGNTNEAGSREGNAVARHVGAPAKVHGGALLGFLLLDKAAQAPSALTGLMDVEQADIDELAANVRANGGPAHLVIAHSIHGAQLSHVLGYTIKLDPRVTAGKLQVV